MTSGTMSLRFPKLGVVRRLGFQQEARQAEYGSPYSMNVRLEDSLTNRLRGGSFTASATNERPCEILYRNRNLTISNNSVLASRVGDHSDTAMSSDVSDMLRPALFQFSEADHIGEWVVALVPHKDQYLLGFTATETWVLRGDPLSGPIGRVSDQVGIVGSNAWCVAHDTVYFLSSRGLYSVSADGSGLKALSEDVIPEDLIGLRDDNIFLDYDHASRGVSIHLPTSPSWFYDSQRGGFWPFDRDVEQSHILLGPLRLGQDDYYGRILDIHGNMAAGSADVTWNVIPGITAEEAGANGKLAIVAAIASDSYAAYVSASGTWAAGRSHRSYPRTRSIWCCILLSASEPWAYESVSMTKILSGKWR